jgi:hypothetical protein
VTDPDGAPVLGRTSWKRFAAVIVPTTALAGVLAMMMQQGALAASFTVSGERFKLSATELDGRGFSQFSSEVADVNGKQHPVAVSAVKHATVTGLCQSVKTKLAGQSMTLTLRAGTPRQKVVATNLVVDAEQLDGNAVFTNVEIGNDASKVTKGGPAKGEAGMFGQQADRVVITNLRQTAWSASAGTFRLPGLKLRLTRNGPEC